MKFAAFKFAQFISELFGDIEELKADIPKPNVIPAKEAKKQWDAHHMKTSQNGLNLIEQFEGCKLSPYLDQKGIPTIGIGSTRYNDGTAVTMDDAPITEDQALEMLSSHLQGVEACINKAVQVTLNQAQFDSISSLIYNIGQGNFLNSTLLKKLNSSDFSGAAEEFLRWANSGGQSGPGLLRRREAEKVLFLS